jgi:hypothetical protein
MPTTVTGACDAPHQADGLSRVTAGIEGQGREAGCGKALALAQQRVAGPGDTPIG